jgi:hypothetical protein
VGTSQRPTAAPAQHLGHASPLKNNDAAAFVPRRQVVSRCVELHSRQNVCIAELFVGVLLAKASETQRRRGQHARTRHQQRQLPQESRGGGASAACKHNMKVMQNHDDNLAAEERTVRSATTEQPWNCQQSQNCRKPLSGPLYHDRSPMEIPKTLFFEGYSEQPVRTLDLSSWQDQVTDSTLTAVAARCSTALTALNLSHCMLWTELGFGDVVRSCPNLKYISTERCVGMNANCLQWLGKHCKRVTHVNLAHCPNVTADGLGMLSANAGNLRMIDVDGCTNLDSAGIAAIANGCKRLAGLRCSDLRSLDGRAAEVRFGVAAPCARATCRCCADTLQCVLRVAVS